MPSYTTIPPAMIPAPLHARALAFAQDQAQALGLFRAPELVWFDDVDNAPSAAQFRAGGGRPGVFEDRLRLWGCYFPQATFAPNSRQEIFVKARGWFGDRL